MAIIKKCDGCGTQIGKRPEGIQGQTPGTCGLPAGSFHWCQGCAAIASRAVYGARAENSQAGESTPR